MQILFPLSTLQVWFQAARFVTCLNNPNRPLANSCSLFLFCNSTVDPGPNNNPALGSNVNVGVRDSLLRVHGISPWNEADTILNKARLKTYNSLAIFRTWPVDRNRMPAGGSQNRKSRPRACVVNYIRFHTINMLKIVCIRAFTVVFFELSRFIPLFWCLVVVQLMFVDTLVCSKLHCPQNGPVSCLAFYFYSIVIT